MYLKHIEKHSNSRTGATIARIPDLLFKNRTKEKIKLYIEIKI